ncbi:prolipoprotein diacylglyceryl transferase family protein [Novosphingobium sp. TH158]|uniref:prolipoprotein diacylglyceryl transferase family protein n=1 Tax=Novosphingobium sp. TH158 TaxID=2067455 RepID=UPI001C1F2AA9|nr:prolipoprotein diacylglyceryl transferase family protein [Novosphingobium sp. TH158]
MISVSTAWWAHYLFDALAWGSAALAARWQHRRFPEMSRRLEGQTRTSYFIALAVGAVIGAWAFGTANTSGSGHFAPSHSVAGALAGGIAAVELWKWRAGITRSTGAAFVLPLAVGIAVGRLGCFFAGTVDFTFGTPTGLPWAVDLGDGVGRHPVQLYESAAMGLFALAYARALIARQGWTREHAFHAFAIVYAAQRFAWEFVKPYPSVVGPLNLFHVLSLGMLAYGIVWWQRGDRPAGA